MSMLNQVSRAAPKTGQRIVIAGQEKVGKTTLICNSPRPLLIPMEMGFASMSVHKTPLIESFPQLCGLLEEIGAACRAGKFPYMSLCFDSATALERLIHAHVLETDSSFQKGNKTSLTMESAHGGYGKAYKLANEKFAQFTRYCDELAVHAGINSIVTCHVFASKVVDPAYGEYSSWDLLLHSPKNEKEYGKREFITQWADMIGFLHEPLFVVKAEKGQQMSKAISANQGRMLAVERTPGWVAGNRYDMTGLVGIPKEKGWNALANAIFEATKGRVDVWNRD